MLLWNVRSQSKNDAFWNYAETETEMVVCESDYVRGFIWMVFTLRCSFHEWRKRHLDSGRENWNVHSVHDWHHLDDCTTDDNRQNDCAVQIRVIFFFSHTTFSYYSFNSLGILVLYHLILFCFKAPNPQPNVCDWPRGTCTYNKEPCPPNWHRCSQFDKGCRLPTNHCCCRR